MAQISRLYVDHDLGEGQTLALNKAQANYLFAVMRLAAGSIVTLFNGRDGEWRAKVLEGSKRGGVLQCVAQSAPQGVPPDLWLLFAPVKKAQTDFIVEKAVEMGVARLCPVQTQYTNSERIRRDKIEARVMEAAEQCGITYLPRVDDLMRLDRVLDEWAGARKLLFCDETTRASPFLSLSRGTPGPWAILIGPEGGFSDTERARLREMPTVVATSLGPRILRAETAAVAALTLWQSTLGDWR